MVLEPGVSMYLPTGTPHAARAQDTVSLHVTIGINQVTWKHVLDRALAGALDEAGAQHLPAGYLDDPAPARRRPGRAAGDAGRRRCAAWTRPRSRTPRCAGSSPAARSGSAAACATGSRPATSSDTDPLRRRPGHPCVLRPDGDKVRLLLGDRELALPGHLAPALAAGPRRGPLRPADLDLDEQSRLVLCRRLVREGLLEVVG